jgi:hypothetical protein
MSKVKFGSYIGVRDDFRTEGRADGITRLIFLSIEVFFNVLLASYVSFLAIKILNPKLMNTISSSCKFTQFIFDKKFVLGLGIAMMAALLISRISISTLLFFNDGKYNKKEKAFLSTQFIIGASVALTGIVCMSLMLANKISPEISSVMEKVFAAAFGVSILAFMVVGLTMLIGGSILHSKLNNNTNFKENFEKHKNNLNIMSDICDLLFGGLSYSLFGKTIIEVNYVRDNAIFRSGDFTIINFFDVCKLELKDKSVSA